MKNRKNMLLPLILASVLAGLSTAAMAQDYPNKPIRLIMPYPVGGSIDIAGRIVAQRLAESLGQPVVVENRTGAGGTVGTEAGMRAVPDGYTIVMGGMGTMALSPNLQKNLPYDPARDFSPVTNLVAIPYVLVVGPSVRANSAADLIAMAKAKPDVINYASGGSGSAPHLAGELFKSMADVRIVHVPYKGSTPAITDTMSGQVQFTFTGIPSIMSQLKSNRLRAIGITSTKRASALPDVPTIAESGIPGYEVNPWFGVLLPARAQPALVARLNSEIQKILQQAAVRERFASEGLEPAWTTPAAFAAYIKTEQAKWGKVIRDGDIHGE